MRIVVVVLCILLANDVRGDEPTGPDHAAKMARGLDLFRREVRQILVGRCVKCHGGESVEGEFDLSTREGLLKGGQEGNVVVLGKAESSRLYKLITHEEGPEMPEDGAKLNDIAIAAVAKWIDLGAPYDKPLVTKEDDPLAWTRRTIDDSSRQFWSFQPLRVVSPPRDFSDTWSRTEIDRFVCNRLLDNNLQPNEMADRRTLIRRAYFDLVGLPPSPEEVERFMSDDDPQAYEKLIDRLLASPHYGERWARHWLDVARFAESHGFEQDYNRPHAYHYRDFVIKALNDDMPYDQFVRWQLAGDEIEPDNPLAMMATGFIGAGVFPTQLTEKEFESARYDELDDIVATIGTSMLGLTIGCARCHDHKFDPIPSADYYRMVSHFTTTIRSEIDLNLQGERYKAELARWQEEHRKLLAARERYEADVLPKRFEAWLSWFKTEDEGYRELDQRVKQHEAEKPAPKTVKVMVSSEGFKPMKHHADGRGFPHFYKQTHFLNRGDVNQKQGVAKPGFLQVLSEGRDSEHWQVTPPDGWRTSYRRRSLANWIADTEYGAGHLLARVIVNRVWHHHLGRGMVATPNDFGFQGQRPTHPDLLDWLAHDLIENGWKLKRLHKQIMTSAVYMQLSARGIGHAKTGADHESNPAASNSRAAESGARAKIDPDNRWFWRYTPRRLEAEIIRDSMLAVSGQLDRTQFGPGTLDMGMKRRSIYFMIKRSKLIPMMQIFDSPEPLVSVGNRPATTIAPQALLFMNNAHVRGYAQAFAKRVAAKEGSHNSQIKHAYQISLAREPRPSELKDALSFLAAQTESYEQSGISNASEVALTDFCQVLMGLNEFLYID